MTSLMPKPPLQAPISDKSGKITVAWTDFFTRMFQRVGEGSALTNIELAGGTGSIASEITTINAEIASLQSAQSNALGLGIGRAL